MPYQPSPITTRPSGSSTAPPTNSPSCTRRALSERRGAAPTPARGRAVVRVAGVVVISCLSEVGKAGREAVGAGAARAEGAEGRGAEEPARTDGEDHAAQGEQDRDAAQRRQ